LAECVLGRWTSTRVEVGTFKPSSIADQSGSLELSLTKVAERTGKYELAANPLQLELGEAMPTDDARYADYAGAWEGRYRVTRATLVLDRPSGGELVLSVIRAPRKSDLGIVHSHEKHILDAVQRTVTAQCENDVLTLQMGDLFSSVTFRRVSAAEASARARKPSRFAFQFRLTDFRVSGPHSAVVQRIVRQSSGAYRTCYEQGLEKDLSLAGSIDVALSIGRDGAVTGVVSNRSELADPQVVDCVLSALRGLRFPPATTGSSAKLVIRLGAD